MGKFYNLPTTIAGIATDAKRYGGQAMLEKMATNLPLVLSEPDTIVGFGMYECSTALSLSQIIIDNEVARYCRRIQAGMNVSPETDFFEDIRAVGQGGHFLKQKSTRSAVRSSEFYVPNLLDKGSYDEWTSLGSRDMEDIAREKAQKILAGEQRNPLPRDTEKVILEIVKEAEAKL
jgi:trimethylamine--corrinoid protein Co-methyltransferase